MERREYNPINYSNVTIHTSSSKKAAKKLNKKGLSHLTTNNDVDTSDSLAYLRRIANEPEPRYPNVYDALLDAKATTTASLNNQRICLPESSTRKSYGDYEEVTIKKMEKTELVPQEKLISIDGNFDAIGRIAFAGCTHLNPMQSVVYETAYKTNKNMLVAAPTGAGKTNVAMMCVLNELRNHFKPNTTEMNLGSSEKFKIIYIAPMKSLATEQTENFKSRLKKLGIKVRELTGDMSLTAAEISQTHIIVTTPEKWDVVTRKSKGDIDLLSLVRLLIIDEVHLLQSDRGPVLEALVARTLRYVEYSQKMTRIIGLSATLPNYVDVAAFLRVNPYEGLFYFDNRFRPVPLTQTFIGVRPLDVNSQAKTMDKICYNLILQYVVQSKQVMIFVHARNSTQRVATKLREMIQLNNKLELFEPDLTGLPDAARLINSTRNKTIRDLFAIGFGIHHAGMIRHDRLLVERLFRQGVLKVLVCTSTLAWGVNFPAHAVIIRGTEVYDSAAGKFVDVGLLDVMQIFGRAGRPQYDSEGHAIIMTGLEKIDDYLRLLTNQTPIESNFTKYLTDNLNAEIVSGTVSNIKEGMDWLRYTYLNLRMSQNPLVYGCEWYEIESDPSLITIRNRLIRNAAQKLDEALMCNFDEQTGELEATYLGRVASHFYINYSTITKYNEILNDQLEMSDILGLIGEAQEFEQIKFREEEANELERLRRMSCRLEIAGGAVEETKGKVSCLLQAYINRSIIECHSLISDLMYISQNATRIARGLFEYALKKRWPMTALNLLRMCKMLESQTWHDHTPFRRFDLPREVISHLERKNVLVEDLEEMSNEAVGKLVNFPEKMGATIKEYLKQLPYVIVEGQVRPIKSNLIALDLTIQPYFKWNDRYHGRSSQNFWMWVVDEEITEQIYYGELMRFTKEQVKKEQVQKLTVNIPLLDNRLDDGTAGQCIPNEFMVFVLSDSWNKCDYEFPIDCRKVILPNEKENYTEIPANANQLPLSSLKNELFSTLFSKPILKSDIDMRPGTSRRKPPPPQPKPIVPIGALQVERFNLLQSQVFDVIYNSDKNVLVCGPTGSGKTILADLAALKVIGSTSSTHLRHKIIYISPLESLVQLKYCDWQERFQKILDKQVVLMCDSHSMDDDSFNLTDMMVSTAHNFCDWLESITSESNLQKVSLIIFDDLHIIGDKRGSKLRDCILKLKSLKAKNQKLRFRCVAISDTVSNPNELSMWLEVKSNCTFNYHPLISRPIQLELHVMSFPERHYNPRMATMNRPIFKAIETHSPTDPVIIYVSSKKQCHLTAKDLISSLVHYAQFGERQWLHMDQPTLDYSLSGIADEDLRLFLEFGIGILYPSMRFNYRRIVEDLFSFYKIQVLICTTNYAYESSLRARLVVVKGTEHYDNDSGRFVDYPPVDVMHMLGRAGRHNLDSTGISVLMISDLYRDFYQKFLYEPFPINIVSSSETTK